MAIGASTPGISELTGGEIADYSHANISLAQHALYASETMQSALRAIYTIRGCASLSAVNRLTSSQIRRHRDRIRLVRGTTATNPTYAR